MCARVLPLLLISGIGAYMKMWTALEAGLPDVRLIAFDAPGGGRSPRFMSTREGAGLIDPVASMSAIIRKLAPAPRAE